MRATFRPFGGVYCHVDTTRVRPAVMRQGLSVLDEAFVEAYPRLVRLAALMVGADAEDVVMDAFMRVRSAERDLDNPAAYLRVSVVNECRSRMRRRMRRPRLVPAVAAAEMPEVDTTWEIVARLPGGQRAVVALRFYEDLSIPQIAALLEMPEGTVKSHLHRAVKSLRAEIGGVR